MASQKSIEKVKEIKLVPAREFFLIPEKVETGLEVLKKEFEQQKQRLAKKKKRNAIDKLNDKVSEVVEKINNGLYFPGLEQYQPYFYPEQGSLIDYFLPQDLICLDEPVRIREALEHQEKERNTSFADLLVAGSVLPGHKFYFNFKNLEILEPRKDLFILLPRKACLEVWEIL